MKRNKNITVTTLLDNVDPNDGLLSLREAVDIANGRAGFDRIDFASDLHGATIRVVGSGLRVTDDLSIQGSGIRISHELAAARLLHVERAAFEIVDAQLTGSLGSLVRGVESALVFDRVGFDSGFAIGPQDSSGGAIRLEGGSLSIRNSSFSNMHATGDGGSLSLEGATAQIVNATFFDSSSEGRGGGIHVADGPLQESTLNIVNSTFTRLISGLGGQNLNAGGGSIHNVDGDVTISNSIFAGNSVHAGGLSVVRNDFWGKPVQLDGTNVLDSGVHATGDIVAPAEVLFAAVNAVGVTRGSDGRIETVFAGEAAVNGGPDWLLTVALRNDPANPAIDSANAGLAPATDQRGVARDASPDIGAFELDTLPPSVAIAISDMALTRGETATVTFAFSEAITGFEVVDIDLRLAAGTISDLRERGGNSWTATFTPGDNVEQAANTIGVRAGSYTDLAGNPGSGATSPVFGIDTTPPVTLAPIAVDDLFTVDAAAVGSKGAKLEILTNDVAQRGKLNTKSVVLVDAPDNGEATLKKGAILYTPDVGFEGTDQLSYTVQDKDGLVSNVAEVTIEVTQPPLTRAFADSFVVEAAAIGKKGVKLDILVNDEPGYGKLDTKSVVITDAPDDGNLSLKKGVVTYVPSPGFEGTDTFAYTVADATGRPSDPATASVTVTQPPLTRAFADSFVVEAAAIGKKGVKLDILVNDEPGYGKLDTKSAVITDGPDGGTASLTKGALVYTPNEGFAGFDEIRYTVADATGRPSNEATVTIDVRQPASLALADLLDEVAGIAEGAGGALSMSSGFAAIASTTVDTLVMTSETA
jgi:hypothetical protein